MLFENKREAYHTTPREEGKTKMGELFVTDGVRGVAHEYPITSEMALNRGSATAYLFKRTGHSPRIIIEKIRESPGICSKTRLYQASVHWGALLVGFMPTPGIAFLTSSMRTDTEIEKYCQQIADMVREKRGQHRKFSSLQLKVVMCHVEMIPETKCGM